MKPYYEEAGITIYHGDCREVLPQLPRVDVVLTDPPYPRLKGSAICTLGGGVAERRPSVTVGIPWGDDITPLIEAWRLCQLGMFVFCSHHSCASIPGMLGADPITLVTWYKRNSMPSINNVPQYEAEFIWAFKKESGLNWRELRGMYDIPMLQAGCMAKERFTEGSRSAHPTQKPRELMTALLKVGGASVLDPYMGTGTTLEAAKLNGIPAIGIEIEERYCEIAAGRLRQGVLDLK